MWLEFVDWANNHSNILLLIMFAVPLAVYAIISIKKYRDKKRKEDWMRNFAEQHRLLEYHIRKYKALGGELDLTEEEEEALERA